MLNKETVTFLKQMNKLTNSVVLEYPITTGKTESADIAYQFDLSKLDSEGFQNRIGIYDLSVFLNIFNLFNLDYKVALDGNVMSVSDSTTSASYLTANLEILSCYLYKPEQFTKLDEFPEVLNMKLTADDIRRIRSASATFRELDTLAIECDERTTLSLKSVNQFQQSSNTFKIQKDEVSVKNFKLYVRLETLNKIPQIDYDLTVRYNKNKDAYRIILSADSLKMILTTKNV